MCETVDLISENHDFTYDDLKRIVHLRNIEGVEEEVEVEMGVMIRWAFHSSDVEKWQTVWSKLEDIIAYYDYRDMTSELPKIMEYIECYSYSFELSNYLVVKMMEFVKDPDNVLMTAFANYCMLNGKFNELQTFAKKFNAKVFLGRPGNNGNHFNNQYYMKKIVPNEKHVTQYGYFKG